MLFWFLASGSLLDRTKISMREVLDRLIESAKNIRKKADKMVHTHETKERRPKLLFLAGSARKGSYNKKLAKAASEAAKEIGADVTFIDLNDYPIPLYNEDLENSSGMPQKAKELKQIFMDHDGFFIASPEYNGSFTPLLKNALDWISRKQDESSSLIAFKGKVAALGSASPGGLGGIRGLVPLRLMLSNIGVIVVPTEVSVSKAFEAFDEQGHLRDPKRLHNTMQEFVTVTTKLKD